jgi:hypothetical protein
MAVANNYGASNIYKWTTSGASCPVGGAGGWGDGTNCATAGTDRPLQTLWPNFSPSETESYKWVTFTGLSGGTTYTFIAGVAGHKGNQSQFVYKWMPAGTPVSNTQGCFGDGTACETGDGAHYYQALWTSMWPDDFGMANVASSTDGTSAYLTYIGANTNRTDSSTYMDIYKWSPNCAAYVGSTGGMGNGTNCKKTMSGSDNSYIYNPGIVTSNNVGAFSSAEAFISNSTSTLILGGSPGASSNSDVYVWTYGANCPASGSWGDGSQCAYGSSNHYFQRLVASNAYRWKLLTENDNGGTSHDYLGVAQTNTSANLYQLSTAGSDVVIPACTVYKNDSTGTTSVAQADSNITGYDTGALTESTKYTLDCGTGYTPWVQVTVAASLPTITISKVDASEPSTNGSFTFTASPQPTSDLTINYTVSGSASATTSADYTALSGTAVISANTPSVTVPITVVGHDDSVYEGTETVVINTTASANYAGTPTGTINITDDETSTSLPPGTFTSCTGTASASCNLGVSPTRTRTAGTVLVTWYLAGLVTGVNGNPSDTCTLSASAGTSDFATQTWPQSGSTWINTGVSVTIQKQTVFTLSCTAPDAVTRKSVTKTVTVIPGFKEI